jgi:metal-responsive CopG/Arc/MetJ family transcriptional regulator
MAGNGTTVIVRCTDDFAKELDEYRRQQSDIPTRAEVLRRLTRSALSKTKRCDGGSEMTGAAA